VVSAIVDSRRARPVAGRNPLQHLRGAYHPVPQRRRGAVTNSCYKDAGARELDDLGSVRAHDPRTRDWKSRRVTARCPATRRVREMGRLSR
jgi:hypothetical protein